MSKAFSVLMSVYAGESPSFMEESLRSVFNQDFQPEKVIVVKDGPIPASLQDVLDRYASDYPNVFQIVGYEVNRGLGYALNFGLQFINTVYVLRMDADDICLPDRFRKQITFLEANDSVDVLGSNISEFINDLRHPTRVKKVPEHHDDILKKSKLQNPVNHMTAAFRAEKVRIAGGYQHAPYFEDYDLWIRMLSAGMIFHNLQESLVLARVGNDMIGKRHGWRYLNFEFSHFRKMYRQGFLTLPEFIVILLLRLPLRIIPKGILALFYKFALRKKKA